MQRICGFIVVRKPEWTATDSLNRNPQISGKDYYGVDRRRWEDFSLAYYDRRLPAALAPIWQDLEQENRDFSGVEVLKSYEQGRGVLDFSGDKSEMIAIWSGELAEIKGAIDTDIELEYLGVDCFSLGEWSVLCDGVFLRQEHFAETVPRLNQWGLLASEDECRRVFERYLQLSATEIVEPLMEQPPMTSISIFRVSR